MKKVWIAGIVLLISAQHALAQGEFRIRGKLDGLNGERKIKLSSYDPIDNFEDSTIVKNGEFSFAGKVTQPQRVLLSMDVLHPRVKPADSMTTADYMRGSISRDIIVFYVDGGSVTITGKDSLKTATIKGGKSQSEQMLLDKIEKPDMDKYMGAYREKIDAIEANDSMEVKRINQIIGQLDKKLEVIEKDFIKQHPDSYVSWSLLNQMGGIIDVPVFEPLFNNMSAGLRNTKEGKELGARLASAKKTAIGRPAPAFTQNDPSGKPVSLVSFRGKYVLVDFWASWCGPCRGENPNVVKAYNRFHDKNFEIISISIDDKKDAWLKAIQEDGMPWLHVSDLKGFSNSVAVMYGVSAVPQNFLIDPAGNIIARNLRGDELINGLEKLIK